MMNYTIFNGELTNDNFIYRYPTEYIEQLGYKTKIEGREKAKRPTGVEIRFKTKAKDFSISFYSTAKGFVDFYIGDFSIKRAEIIEGQNEIEASLHERFTTLGNKKTKRFPEDVFRVQFEAGGYIKDVKISCSENIEPYTSNLKKVVLYGSSISEGAGSFAYPYSWANILANELNIDILNKGLSGNCLCEESTVDYLKSLNPDAYLLELGCNMRGCMDENEFEKRIDYLFNTLSSTNKPIYVISTLLFFKKQFAIFKEKEPYKKENRSFTQIIKRLAKKYNITVISMNKLMREFTDVSYDMLHPSIMGHLHIGTHLAKELKKYFD